MLTASAQFGEVVEGVYQVVDCLLTLDLPGADLIDFDSDYTRCMVSVDLSVQNGTDLPDAVRDTSGFTTIGGSVVLAGPVAPLRKESVAWLFNPDETDSPLYRTKIKGAGVTVDIGARIYGQADPERVRKLTGKVADVELDHAAGVATLQVVDLTVDWTGPINTPAVITAPPYNAGLTSEFPMDAIIRSQNGARGSTWRATRDQCLLAVGMRSSVWPEVGTLSASVVPAFARVARGSALAAISSAASYNMTGAVGSTLYAEWSYSNSGSGSTQVLVGPAAFSPPVAGVELYRDETQVRVRFYEPVLAVIGEATWAVSSADDYTAVSVTVPPIGGTAWSATMHVGTATHSTGPLTLSSARASDMDGAFLRVTGAATLSEVQITGETAPVPTPNWTPAAVLDQSLNPLTVVPEIPADSTALDVLQQIAGAELGNFGLDEYGIARFSNRATIAAQGVSRTITSRASLLTLTTSIGATTEYNHIQVPYTEWTFGARTAIFTLGSNKKIPAHQTVEWTQTLDALAADVDGTVSLLPDGHTPTDGGSWYRSSGDASGVTPGPGLKITAVQVSSGTLKITAVNTTAMNAWLTTPATNTDLTAGLAGTGLWIGGAPAAPGDEAIADITYGASDKTLAVSSYAYLQDHDTAVAVGYFLLAQLFCSIRDYTNVAVIPDARVQIGDLDKLEDPVRSQVNEYAFIWGWSLSAAFAGPGETGGTWAMSLDMRAIGPPGAWRLGEAGRSELGSTTYLYA